METEPRIILMDTTLRDGEQTQGISFTPAEKTNVAKALLNKLRVDRIEIILEAGGRVMNLLTKGSENHCTNQLRKTIDEHLKDIRKTLKYAHQNKVKVNVYLEDWSNGYRDLPDYVYDMVAGLKDEGVERIMLPDTLGVMSPDQVYQSMMDMQERFPWAAFDFHPHNDYGLGLSPVSEMVENFSGKRLARNSPIVGEDVFTQTSGIHADGDRKGGLYHNPIYPERFGRNRSYALGKMSGKASLVKNLELLGIQLVEDNLQKVLRRIVELGDSKKTITLADLPFIITDVLETHEEQRIELLNCSISSGLNLKSVASIRIMFDKKEHNESGSGNGGYDAFMSAVKKILKKHHLQCPP